MLQLKLSKIISNFYSKTFLENLHVTHFLCKDSTVKHLSNMIMSITKCPKISEKSCNHAEGGGTGWTVGWSVGHKAPLIEVVPPTKNATNISL